VGERARGRAVYTERMVMMDAVDGSEVAAIPVGEAFRQRFGNPYAVIHRADAHGALLEGAKQSGRIGFAASTRIERFEQDDRSVTVFDGNGVAHRGLALIGADGVRSAVREQLVG